MENKPIVEYAGVDHDGQPMVNLNFSPLIESAKLDKFRETIKANPTIYEQLKSEFYSQKLNPMEFAIAIINKDDETGTPMADILNLKHNWTIERNGKEIPLCGGLTKRQGLQFLIDSQDEDAGNELQSQKGGLSIVIVDYNSIGIFCK